MWEISSHKNQSRPSFEVKTDVCQGKELMK
jgi:hypothetical protein